MMPFENIGAGFNDMTQDEVFSEEDLLLGILWEGDLEIHSNAEKMKATPFGERIVHGDSVTVKSISQIIGSAAFSGVKTCEIRGVRYSFLSPVYINDRLYTKFIVTGRTNSDDGKDILVTLDYQVFKKGTEKPVSQGSMSIAAINA